MQSEIEGVCFFKLDRFDDDRGWLIEAYRNDSLEEEHKPQMAYVSMTKPGVARGPHEHEKQSDYFVFAGPGDFRLYLWERRDHTIHREEFLVGAANPVAVVVPPGVVHAYKNVGHSMGYVFNAPNKLFAGPGKKYPVDEIRHEDDVNQLYRMD